MRSLVDRLKALPVPTTEQNLMYSADKAASNKKSANNQQMPEVGQTKVPLVNVMN